MKPELLFEDEDYVAFSKPSGLLSIPDRFHPEKTNLVSIVRQYFSEIFVVHRLDKDTSGIICFAKNKAAHHYLSECFTNRKTSKEYQAIVFGTPLQESNSLTFPLQADPVQKGRMQVSVKGKESRTDYEVLEKWKHFSLLKINLYTGRTHQIRVHLSHIGHPVVCDSFYGDGQPFLLSSVKRKYKLSDSEEAETPILNRLALHSYSLHFISEKGKDIFIESPLPKDMKVMVKLLRKWD